MVHNFWLSVGAAAVTQYVIGMLWYMPLFGKVWMKELKIKKTAKPKNMGKTMVIGFICSLVMATVMAKLLPLVNVLGKGQCLRGCPETIGHNYTMCNAFGLAVLIWLGFYVTALLSDVLYSGKPLKVFWIDTGYYLVSLLAVTWVLISL